AGVGHSGKCQASANGSGDGAQFRGEELTAHQAGDNEGTGDQAHLTLEVPTLGTSDDVSSGGGEGTDPTGEHLGGFHPGGSETLAGLLRADTGLADQDHALTETLGELFGVLGD